MTTINRGFFSILAVGALWLTAAAGDPSPFEKDEQRMDELQAEMTGLQKAIGPMLKELGGLQKSYTDLAKFSEAAKKRTALRSQLDAQLKLFAAHEQHFNKLRESTEIQKVALGLQMVMQGGKVPDTTGKEFVRANLGLEFASEAQRFRNESEALLKADDEAFRGAQELAAADQRRRMMTWGVGVAAVVLVLLVALLLTARKLHTTAATQVAIPAGRAPAALPGPAQDSFEPGQLLTENYRIEKELGRGGMGVVYGAVDLALQRRVAIKLMQRELAQQEDELGLFLSEARLVAQLKHPNLVEIYHIHRENGRLALIFEFVEGSPLNRFLAGGRRLPLAHVKLALRQVASALDYAHSKKVIHRDLKPANVMVAKDGTVKVMDFGIAYQAKLTVAKATRVNAWGTPAYMAPEQELGRISRESDLFAMGVMAYEMLTGRIPFAGPNFLAQKQQRVYVPATQVAKDLPKGTDAVLDRALSPDPASRYRSAGEFAAALESVQA